MEYLLGGFVGDPISLTPEHVEESFGEVIENRDQMVTHLLKEGGLGPPDLCWLRKVPAGKSTPSKNPAGSYHHILGLDVSSQAGIAAYFATLSAGLEVPSGMKKMLKYGTMIEGGIYCTYDAFTRTDLRCELSVPGGVTTYAIDGEGNQYNEVDPEVWRGARLSAILRAIRADAAVILTAGCTRRFPVLPTPAVEDAVLADVVEMYTSGEMDGIEPILIGRVDTASEAKRRLFDRSEPEDVILDTLLTHFRSHQRLSRGIDFFGQLVTVHAPAAISLAALLRLTGRVEQAVSLLQTATGDLPDSARLRLELSECFMEGGNGEGAVAAAMEACAINPTSRTGWLALARALAFAGEPGRALVALNCATPVHSGEDKVEAGPESLFPVFHDPPETITAPAQLAHDPFLDEAARLQEDDALVGKRAALARLPGLSSLPLPGVWEPSQLPANCHLLRPREALFAATYSVLVDIVEDLGWEEFLSVRSSIFAMEPEEDEYTEEAEEYEEEYTEEEVEEEEELTEGEEAGAALAPATADAAAARQAQASPSAAAAAGGNQQQQQQAPARPSEELLRAQSGQVIVTADETVLDLGGDDEAEAGGKREPPAASPAASQAETSTSGGLLSYAASFFTSSSSAAPAAVPASPKRTAGPVTEARISAAKLAGGRPSPRRFLPRPGGGGESAPAAGAPAAGPGPVCEMFGGAAGKLSPSTPGPANPAAGASLASASGEHRTPGYSSEMPKSTGSSTPRDTTLHTPREGSRGHALVEEALRAEGAVPSPSGGVAVPSAPALESAVLSGGEEEVLSGGDEGSDADASDGDAGARAETDRQRAAAERNAAYAAAEKEMQRDRAALAEARPLEATRMCCEWLDSLIHVLYEDMAEFMDWRLSERERNPAKGPALDAGSKEAQAGLSGADWMRRGLLAERLKRRDDAEWAYRVCVNLGFNFTAWAALARIYSEMGLVSETLVAAAQLMSAHNSVQEWKEYRQIPPSVGRALGGLVARVGLRAVQEAADKMDDVDEAIRYALQECVRWKSEGFGAQRGPRAASSPA